MKTTFKIIDKIIMLIAKVPKEVISDEGKKNGKRILSEVIEYTESLKKLVSCHQTYEYMDRLHRLHIREIDDWEEQVENNFKKFEKLLKNLESDLKKLLYVIDNAPHSWLSNIQYITQGMYMSGLHHEIDELKHLRKIEIFEENELKKIIDAAHHLAEIMK